MTISPYRHRMEDILAAMDRYGGQFVQILARLYRAGDPINQRILEDAFQPYFQQYDEMAGG